jgi:hypothetical protein
MVVKTLCSITGGIQEQMLGMIHRQVGKWANRKVVHRK